MKIILIGNYLPDKQESMIRFASLLETGFKNAGIESEIWRPKALFGFKAKSTSYGFGKWLGYLDKYLIFPLVLSKRLSNKKLNDSNIRFHICDHSNSPYLKYLPIDRTAITCHDVIAIRGGLGYTDFYHPASRLGKYLQKWILSYLVLSRTIAFVSQLTLNQFKELAPDQASSLKNWEVIHNSFNDDFYPMSSVEAKDILIQQGIDVNNPFLLHVGSGLERKNRKLLLDMAANLQNWKKVNVCFAGERLNGELKSYAEVLGLSDQVISIEKPNHTTLVALYSSCSAFVFPSFSEGFGWPVIEAQACGAPVIASNIEPMPEISGGAALHFDPTNAVDFANGYRLLQEKDIRHELILKGYKNCLRFGKKQMTEKYLNVHNLKSNPVS